VGYRWKGPFNTYNFFMTHFLLNPIFTRVNVKIKRNLPTPVGSAARIFFLNDSTLLSMNFRDKQVLSVNKLLKNVTRISNEGRIDPATATAAALTWKESNAFIFWERMRRGV